MPDGAPRDIPGVTPRCISKENFPVILPGIAGQISRGMEVLAEFIVELPEKLVVKLLEVFFFSGSFG